MFVFPQSSLVSWEILGVSNPFRDLLYVIVGNCTPFCGLSSLLSPPYFSLTWFQDFEEVSRKFQIPFKFEYFQLEKTFTIHQHLQSSNSKHPTPLTFSLKKTSPFNLLTQLKLSNLYNKNN